MQNYTKLQKFLHDIVLKKNLSINHYLNLKNYLFKK